MYQSIYMCAENLKFMNYPQARKKGHMTRLYRLVS